MRTVTWDERSYLVDGRRTWLTCGEMHYFRVPADLWRARLREARQAGLTCISTYMAWNLHEPEEGRFDFTGDLDIRRYIETAGEEGLAILLRPGPYICSEWDYGGLPAWLNTVPGLKIRTDDPAFARYWRRYFSRILPDLAGLDATRGGNILLVQNENEHHMPAVPGRLAYFRDITASFRDAGFRIPILNCNRLFEGNLGCGTIECVNTWDDPAGDLLRMRQVQPDAPLLVTEFWCGGVDWWGRPHAAKGWEAVLRKALEILGAGGQYTYYMWHGGTNFGFMGGRLQYAASCHVPTSYDLDAPLGEGGRRAEKYYATRLSNLLSSRFGDQLADRGPCRPDRDDAGELRLETVGPSGNWLYLADPLGGEPAEPDPETTTVPWANLDGPSGRTIPIQAGSATLSVSLPPWGAVFLPFNLRLRDDLVLDHANCMPLGFFPDQGLVVHGPPGTETVISLNGVPYRLAIPDRPVDGQGLPSLAALETEACRVIAVSSGLAARAWETRSGLLFGPAYADPDGVRIVPADNETGYRSVTKEGIRACPYPATARATGPDLPLPFSRIASDPPDGSESDWMSLPAPQSVDEIGIPYGYAWYRISWHQEQADRIDLFLPYCEDRATIFHNGQSVGLWGTGPGAVRAPIPLHCPAGENRLVLLLDNLGRFCHAWRMGESKGLFGPAFQAVRIPVEPWPAVPARTFVPSMVPHKAGHRNEDDHVEGLVGTPYRTHGVRFRLDAPVPVHLQAESHSNLLLVCNGQVVDFFDIPGSGYLDLVLPETLSRAGDNMLEFLVWEDREMRSPGSLVLHALWQPLFSRAAWSFRPWRIPEGTAAPGEGTVGPAWFSARFPQSDVATMDPLWIRFPAGLKGQLFLNGWNAGRVWTLPPQDTYYLPSCRMEPENEIRLFVESGNQPGEAVLTSAFHWLERDRVTSQPDVVRASGHFPEEKE